ncbi:Gramicidin S synthase 1 [compost metagenome]
MQGSLSLEEGKLIHLGVIRTTKEDYLCIIIHHLVIDGVSWRILLEDFHKLYEKCCTQLPPKTSSYQVWANELQNYAQSKKLKQEITYWQRIEASRGHELPKDTEGPNVYRMEDGETIALTLGQEQTRELLTIVHRAYQTEINDLLLAALVLAIKTWTQGSKVLVNMEGHGREEVIAGVDVNRTIGWFTTVYPVLFEVQKNDIETTIQTVKETLRRVPAKGIGYGIIKYLFEDQWKMEPEISFNYLGQFDKTSSENLGGMEIAPENHSQYILDINGLVEEEKLKLYFTYNSYVFRSNTMQSLLDSYKEYLLAIIDHCKGKKETQRTPSDFGMKELSIDDLNDIFSALSK